jgi:hypothetical protein
MDVGAKQVSYTEISRLTAEYFRTLTQLKAKVDDYRSMGDNPYAQRTLRIWASPFIQRGVLLAQAVLGTKEPPPSQRKAFEQAVRLFMSASRGPNKVIEWFDKNQHLMNLLYEAADNWPDKIEGQTKFQMGPFTVHNSIGLEGSDLEATKDALTRTTILLKASQVPGIQQVLYGDVMVVAKITKARYIAWYYPGEDVVYLRPFKNAGADELNSILHELGHRYVHKFIDKATWRRWQLYHSRLEWQKTNVTAVLPQVGDSLPFLVKGIKGRPIIQKIETEPPYPHRIYYLSETKFVSEPTMKAWIQESLVRGAKYPTTYSATNAEEHFCESFALYAAGKLKEPHLSAFKTIIEEGKEPEMKLGTRIPPGWVTTFGGAGRPIYTSPEGLLRIQDGGFGRERFQVLYQKGGEYLEDTGWPSLKGALEYVSGKRSVKDHPSFRPTELNRQWNEKVRKENMKLGMAGTYVRIDREDLEDWLGTIRLHAKAYRAPNKAGVYLLPFSDTVAVKLSSTIGTSDDAMGRGMASMQLSLVSTVTGQVLNKKAQGQGHFKRTTNWKKTWAEGIERMRDAYMKSQGFYDALASIQDREQYQKDILAAIESVPDWRNNNILSDFHGVAEKGGILTVKQRDLLDRTLDRSLAPKAPQVTEDPLIAVLRALYTKARAAEDTWLMDFTKSVADQIKRGRPLSPKQQDVLDRARGRFKVATRVAQRYLGV